MSHAQFSHEGHRQEMKMTQLSDADREMAVKILELWYGDEIASAQVDESPEDTSAMLTAARTLVTAEILAAAKVSEDKMVEAMARAIAFSGTTGEKPTTLPSEDLALFVPEAMDALTAIKPTLARLAAENARLREQLDWHLSGARFAMNAISDQTVNLGLKNHE